uniref:Uncharacterized protein n=1 Tax=Clytia hemisphaerica TaxID=252671 RepID=A0A7M5WUZ1_9CNID
MPKEGLSNSQWKKRLEDFADHKFRFGTGTHPKSKERKAELERVKGCPAHSSNQKIGIFNTKIVCICGYHNSKSQTNSQQKNQPSTSTSTSHLLNVSHTLGSQTNSKPSDTHSLKTFTSTSRFSHVPQTFS